MSDVDTVSGLRRESVPADLRDSSNMLVTMRAMRVARGWSHDDVALRIKYPAKLIDALESERWEELPRGVALRSLARNYARLLGVDPQAVETQLKDKIGTVQGGIANHTSIRTLGPQREHVQHGSLGWILLILAVVIVALGVAIWQGLVPQSWVPGWLAEIIK
jgi:cytoskeletal protein RodZ